ncbi:hypothetical protein M3204_08955 [Mesobacillus subterraneus]|uniref:hypothetical protein n=1 Tax=Mesobacillus subterraneus TaxID=285983 RepID=UPI00203ACA81|nr:hypothetical protein [Mesobacillus subterraneus]MCM3664529.1 hypothetical protein [Mesobacillus subterraneus]MCM3683955.1 hypothetical protein [Mesobacillus subterraneus]
MKRNIIFILGLLLIGLVLTGCQEKQKDSVQESKQAGESKATAEKSKQADEAGFTSEDKVVTINGKVLTYEDLQFYQLMNKVDIELNREQDQQKLKDAELTDKLAYWDEQLKYHDNFNVNLSKMIEQHAMYLLAREKGLDVEVSEVAKTIEEFTVRLEQNEPASQLVAAYPDDAFKNRLNSYFTEKMLTKQIYETLKTDVRKEKPNASEKEVVYDTSKNYDGLYQSQIASLEIKINAAEKE